MPGMAASPKIFEFIKFPSNYKIIYLKWIKPNTNELIKSYAKRMSVFITDVVDTFVWCEEIADISKCGDDGVEGGCADAAQV